MTQREEAHLARFDQSLGGRKFDRIHSSLNGLPDTKMTRPSTLLDQLPIIGDTTTYVVQTHRAKDEGFTIFLQVVDAEGRERFVIPPKVAAAIYRQRQSLTDRSTPESRKRKADARARAKKKAEKVARRARYANKVEA